MTRAWIVAAVVTVVGAVGFGGAAQGGTLAITKMEARTLPAADVLHRVLDQFADTVVLPAPLAPAGRPKHPLTDMYYATRPRGTDVRDLCQTDRIAFDFAPVGADRGADTAVKVSAIRVQSRFRFLAPPSAPSGRGMSAAEHGELTKRCAKLDPETDFFEADSAESALEGGLLLQVILKDVAGGALPASYDCGGESATVCVKNVQQAAVDALVLVRRCYAFATGQNAECLDVWSQNVGFSVLFTRSGDTLKTVRVHVGEMVTTADLRED